MEQNRNDKDRSQKNGGKRPVWLPLIITVAIILVASVLWGYISNSQYTKTTYSDTDYMLLCFVIEKITGMRLDEYLDTIFWTPMGLDNITYNPLENGWTVDQCAATELDGNKRADLDNLGGYDDAAVVDFNNMRDGVIQGTVHDEKCYYTMDGISGHAGMYANAEDLAKLCSVMLTGGYGENHYFTSSTMEQFI